MLLYLRIFDIDRGMRLPIYLGIVFQALFYSAMIGAAIGSIAECNGPSQFNNQYCKNYGKPVVVLHAAVNVATDIYILLLPIPRVLKLQLGRRHRLGLLLVFATGVVTCAVSLTCLIIFCVHYNDPDILWVQGRNAQFTIVEINVAIVVACATCFPAFFAKTRIFSTRILSFLQSRIVTTSAHSAIGQNSTVVKKTSADSDGCYGDKAKLKDDSYFELRDTNDLGGFTVVGAAGRS
ncbi:hypothetical protein ABVK25_011440 [Lepraria finkii]|uniref:Rhodopsin domain-containing protein n=1 Tax=Lepraria finkii TaxID=1340010 RepID=A0ABR4ARN7_9LECA